MAEKGLSEKKILLLFALLAAVMIAIIAAAALLAPLKIELGAPGRVAVIRIQGPLSYAKFSLLGSMDVSTYVEMIDRARKDPLVKAVVLYVNSPGGDVAASETLYYAVRKLSEEKVVIAYIEGLGTSGAYEAVLPADYIIASNSSLVGAIGVYMMVYNIEDLMGKLGVQVYTYKSGPLKDIGSPFRKPAPEEEAVFREIVNEFFRIFKLRVLKHRGKVSDEVFTGRPFTARQAVDAGLIDAVGTYDDAIKKARELAGLPESAPAVELKPPRPSLLEVLFGGAASQGLIPIPRYQVLAMWPEPMVTLVSG